MGFAVNNIITGGIMTTYHCSVSCAHCRHNASPKREKRFISEETLAKVLVKLKTLGCSSLHIEGGEPFLFPNELIRTVKQIADSEITLEHVITNCSWYKNQKDTLELLKKLQANGLGRMVLKVGPFQNESIPLRKVQNVAQAAEIIGLNILIWDNEFYPEVAAFDPTKKHSLKKYIKKYGEDYISRIAQRFNVTFSGRSFAAYEKHLPKTSTQEILSNNYSCRKEMKTQHHFHVDADGNFTFPYTQGLAIHYEDLGKPINPDKYPFVDMIYKEGVNGLYKYAKTQHQFIAKKEYLSKCHLCHDIRSYLVNEAKVISHDLKPLGFYQED